MNAQRPAAAPRAAPTRTALDAASELPRQQMAVATQGACALFRGFEAMRKIQEQAAHQAFTQHAAAADKLRGPCQPADLMAIQTGLLLADLEGAAQYWQQLGAAAIEMHNEMLGCWPQLMDSASVLSAAHALEAMPVLPAGFGAFFTGRTRPAAA